MNREIPSPKDVFQGVRYEAHCWLGIIPRMRAFCQLITIAIICATTGCSPSKLDRIVVVRDNQGRPLASKNLRFAHSRESWIPWADSPLFGPGTVIVEVPLDANGQARIHLRAVSWWVSFDTDLTREGHSVLSITPSDLQKGGTFHFYKPPPTIGDTNVFLSDYCLTIKKP